jgi:hypothetical protein
VFIQCKGGGPKRLAKLVYCISIHETDDIELSLVRFGSSQSPDTTCRVYEYRISFHCDQAAIQVKEKRLRTWCVHTAIVRSLSSGWIFLICSLVIHELVSKESFEGNIL